MRTSEARAGTRLTPRAFLGSLELELLGAGPPIALGPILAEQWHPLEAWPSGPTPKLAIVMEPSLARHPLRFELPSGTIEAKVKDGVDGKTIAIREPLGWSHGEAVPIPEACVNAFLDAAFAGDVAKARASCSELYAGKAIEKAIRSIPKKHGAETDLPRKLEGRAHPRHQRVIVCNAIFGARGITAFVTVAPIDGRWLVLASAFSAFTPQAAPSAPPIPTM